MPAFDEHYANHRQNEMHTDEHLLASGTVCRNKNNFFIFEEESTMMVCPYNSPWFLSMDNTKVLKYLFLNTTEILDLYENH